MRTSWLVRTFDQVPHSWSKGCRVGSCVHVVGVIQMSVTPEQGGPGGGASPPPPPPPSNFGRSVMSYIELLH